jgi:MFS family permease
MTATPIAEAPGDDSQLFCYRHPDRETWIRCGRCDRPICTSCAMQGPVGSRCKQCGKLAFDPLTSFTPTQLVLGIATALIGGVVSGFIAARIGFFAIFVSYFAGGFIAEFVGRATGFKRGPIMLAIVFGGIVAGTLIGAIGGFWIDYGMFFNAAAGEEDAFPLQSLIANAATWALVSAGAACVGAWQRVRF